MYVCMYVWYVCMYICMYVYVCMYVCMVCMYVCMYVCVRMYQSGGLSLNMYAAASHTLGKFSASTLISKKVATVQ